MFDILIYLLYIFRYLDHIKDNFRYSNYLKYPKIYFMIFWDIVDYLKYVHISFEIWLEILRNPNRYLAKSAIFKNISRYLRYLVIFQICWDISKVDLSKNDWDILHICRYLRYFGISWLISIYLRFTTSQMAAQVHLRWSDYP